MLTASLSELIALRKAINPSALNLLTRKADASASSGKSLLNTGGMEFDSIRHYVYGDDVRHIDWRATARTLKPHIKTFHANTEQNLWIVIDHNLYMSYGTRGTFKSIQAARAAALLAWLGIFNKNRIGGLKFSHAKNPIEVFPSCKDSHYLLDFFKSLCIQPELTEKYTPLEKALTALLQQNISQATVFLISDFTRYPNITEHKSLISLNKNNKVAYIHIYDAIDQIMPNFGTVDLQQPHSSAIRLQTNNKKAQYDYMDNWEKFHISFTQQALRKNISTLWINTADDLPSTLLSQLLKKAPRNG